MSKGATMDAFDTLESFSKGVTPEQTPETPEAAETFDKSTIDGWLGANDHEDLFAKAAGAGGLPTGESTGLPQGGATDGGPVAAVGKTSGSNTAAGLPAQDEPEKGKKQKLSEDDDVETSQMRPGVKPLEASTRKSFATPNDLDNDRAHLDAVAASRMQKAETETVVVGHAGPGPGPELEPMEKARVWDQGSGSVVVYSNAADLSCENYLEKGESVSLGGGRSVLNSSVLCKSCDGAHSAMLTACPHCSTGVATAQPVPGVTLEKSHGPILRPATRAANVVVGRPDSE